MIHRFLPQRRLDVELDTIGSPPWAEGEAYFKAMRPLFIAVSLRGCCNDGASPTLTLDSS